jgi:hypothetical protein
MRVELIDHIKSEMKDLEVEYRSGAWEDFQGHTKVKKAKVVWMKILAKAAVVLIFTASAIIFTMMKYHTVPNTTTSIPGKAVYVLKSKTMTDNQHVHHFTKTKASAKRI